MKSRIVLTGLALAATVVAPGVASAQDTQDVQARAEHRMKGMDKDADGAVSMSEFTEYRRKWTSKRDDAAAQMKPDVVQKAFARIDRNGDNSLSFDEVLEDTQAMKPRK